MKRDYRKSQVPDLNFNFRDYISASTLAVWFSFNIKEDSDGKLPNKARTGTLVDDARWEVEQDLKPYSNSIVSNPYSGQPGLYSAKFDRESLQGFLVPYSSTLPTAATHTFAMWVYIPSAEKVYDSSTATTLLARTRAGFSSEDEWLRVDYSNNYLSLKIRGNSSSATWNTSPGSLSGLYDKWTHVAWSLEEPGGDTLIRWYINGENVNPQSASALGGIVNYTDALLIGIKKDGTNAYTDYFTGYIHSVAGWSSILSSKEIKSLYEAAKFWQGSGAISLSPRVQIIDRDQGISTYPTNKQPGDQRMLGTRTPFFDDDHSTPFGHGILEATPYDLNNTFYAYDIYNRKLGRSKYGAGENLKAWYRFDKVDTNDVGLLAIADSAGKTNAITSVAAKAPSGSIQAPYTASIPYQIQDKSLDFSASSAAPLYYSGTLPGMSFTKGLIPSLPSFLPHDTPLTFACWISASAASFQGDTGDTHQYAYLFSRIGSGVGTPPEGPRCYLYDGNDDGAYVVNFKLEDANLNELIGYSPSVQILDQGWMHFAVTYDGNGVETRNATACMKIYINGQSLTVYNSTSAGGENYAGLKYDEDATWYFGKKADGIPSAYRWPGLMAEIAFWDKALTHEEVRALYLAPKWVRGGKPHGGHFKLVPDLSHVNYPSLAPVPTDLEVAFTLGGAAARFPARSNMLRGQFLPPTKLASSSYATPNTLPLLAAPGNASARVLGSYAPLTASLHNFDDSFAPFNDSRIHLGTSSFYMSGSSAIYGFQGSIRNKIQIEIDLTPSEETPMSRTAERDKTGQGLFPNKIATGMYYWNKDVKSWRQIAEYDRAALNTHDPSANYNAPLCQGTVISVHNTNGWPSPWATGSVVRQFYGTPTGRYLAWKKYYGEYMAGYADESHLGLSPNPYFEEYQTWYGSYREKAQYAMQNIGFPTANWNAPSGLAYHATASELINLSDYINEPIYLEKIRLDLPVTAERRWDWYQCYKPEVTTLAQGDNAQARGQQHLDSYTFFIYRQQDPFREKNLQYRDRFDPRGARGTLDDIRASVTGSDRELIGFSTAVFYNKWISGSWEPGFALATTPTRNATGFKSYATASLELEDFNNDAIGFTHEWGVPPGPGFQIDDANPRSIPFQMNIPSSSFTGSITLEFTPSVAPASLVSNSQQLYFNMAYAASPMYSASQGAIWNFPINNYWPGGSMIGSRRHNMQVSAPASEFDPGVGNYRNTGQKPTGSQLEPIPLIITEHESDGYVPYSRATSFTGWSRLSYASTDLECGHFYNENVLFSRHLPSFASTAFQASLKTANRPVDQNAYSKFWIQYPKLELQDTVVLLRPSDDLILGIEANPLFPFDAIGGALDSSQANYADNTALFQAMTGSYLRTLINRGAKLTLFGSTVRDGRSVTLSSPQQLTTNALHRAVSGGPVLDQLEIDPPNAYSGSINEYWIRGGMTRPTDGWPRSPVQTTDISGSVEEFPNSYAINGGDSLARQVVGSVSDGNVGDMFSLQRFSRIVDDDETYYDSLVPAPPNIWNRDGIVWGVSLLMGGKYSASRPGQYRWGHLTASEEGLADHGGVCNNSWAFAFPFEPRYANLQRYTSPPLMTGSKAASQDQDSVELFFSYQFPNGSYWSFGMSGSYYPGGYINNQGIEWQAQIDKQRNGIKVASARVLGASVPGPAGGLLANTFENLENLSRKKAPPAWLKTFFGTSNQPFNLPEPQYYDTSQYPYLYAQVNKTRGWKYGLINAVPTNSTMVYRNNHYGQFRDMLEQRDYSFYQYTSVEPTYVSVPPTKTRFSRFGGGRPAQRDQKSLVKRIPGKFELSKDPPVEVKFTQPTWMDPLSTSTQVTPEETQSSNLSIFATSSVPYFDGVVRNRGPLTSDGDVDVVLV